MGKDNPIVTKSFDFSLSTIRLYKHLTENKEYVLSKQLLRSATRGNWSNFKKRVHC